MSWYRKPPFAIDSDGWDALHLVRPEQFTDRPRLLDSYRVEPGDAVVGMSGERCEGMARIDGDPGDRHRWTWVTKFPAGFLPNPGRWNFWSQWHALDTKWPQAPVALTVDNSIPADPRLVLRLMGGAAQQQRYYDLGPLVKGVRFHIQADLEWGAEEGTGSTRVYFNDVLSAEDVGPNCYPGDAGTYFKQGFYRGASDLTTVIAHGHAKCVTF